MEAKKVTIRVSFETKAMIEMVGAKLSVEDKQSYSHDEVIQKLVEKADEAIYKMIVPPKKDLKKKGGNS